MPKNPNIPKNPEAGAEKLVAPQEKLPAALRQERIMRIDRELEILDAGGEPTGKEAADIENYCREGESR